MAYFPGNLSWIAQFIAIVNIISCRTEGLLGQADHVLQGGEDHTQVVRRLDQLADHVDGLFGRVEVDVCGAAFRF